MRDVRADFAMTVPGTATCTMLAIPAAGLVTEEHLALAVDGVPIEPVIATERHGTRVVRFAAGPGTLTCAYTATVGGMQHDDLHDDVARYLQPSRYVEVGALSAFASERFGNAHGWDAVDAIRAWVARSLRYDMFASELDDGAVATLGKRGGMCRDFSHVMIALCRALGIPARYVSVYAPALQPPDFHAVTEVHLDGAWWVVDATGLAPRRSMVRIATGIDAEETAWLSNTGAIVELQRLEVAAHDDTLAPDARDDPRERVRLA